MDMDIVESVQYGVYPLCLIGRFLLNLLIFILFFSVSWFVIFVWQTILNVQYGADGPEAL